MFYLALGDAHIPYRAANIPEALWNRISKGKYSHIFFTGNACSLDVVADLKKLCNSVLVARGDFDTENYNESIVTSLTDDLKVGVVHGHQIIPWNDEEALAMYQRQLNCDVMIHGSTHTPNHFVKNKKLFLNPGSCTGAFHTQNPESKPSFMLLDVVFDVVQWYTYTYDAESDSVNISCHSWTKGTDEIRSEELE
ncbi:hypothetical protein PCE1_000015 [Barthelona sp. PCE]